MNGIPPHLVYEVTTERLATLRRDAAAARRARSLRRPLRPRAAQNPR